MTDGRQAPRSHAAVGRLHHDLRAEADELEAGPQHLRSDDGKFPPE